MPRREARQRRRVEEEKINESRQKEYDTQNAVVNAKKLKRRPCIQCAPVLARLLAEPALFAAAPPLIDVCAGAGGAAVAVEERVDGAALATVGGVGIAAGADAVEAVAIGTDAVAVGVLVGAVARVLTPPVTTVGKLAVVLMAVLVATALPNSDVDEIGATVVRTAEVRATPGEPPERNEKIRHQ